MYISSYGHALSKNAFIPFSGTPLISKNPTGAILLGRADAETNRRWYSHLFADPGGGKLNSHQRRMTHEVEEEMLGEESIPCPIVLLRGEMLTEEMDGLYRVTTKDNAVSDILTVRLACGAGDATTFSGSRLYYEARVESGGAVVLGLAGPGFDDGVETQPERPGVGDVMPSWAFDGARRRKRTRQISNMYGQRWKAGDMVGVLLDIETKEISFSLNGQDLGPAFTLNDDEVKGLYPAASLHFGQAVVFNFGRAPFEYNPRERGSKLPEETKPIEPPKPKPRRKSSPSASSASGGGGGGGGSSSAGGSKSAGSGKGPAAGSKGKRSRYESAGEESAVSAVDDDRTSDGDIEEPVYVADKSGKSNGHACASSGSAGAGGGSNAITGGEDEEAEVRAQFEKQTKEINNLLKHETLLEGMQEMHSRHRRERKALLATQRKEVQKFFQRRHASEGIEDDGSAETPAAGGGNKRSRSLGSPVAEKDKAD